LDEAFKKELRPINQNLDNLNQKVAGLVVDFPDIKTELKSIKETLNTHSGILDEILKNTNDWRIEMAVMRDRLDRYERVIKIMAEKLNVDVEPILH
jgi:regulator of replication initiation timing